MEHSVQNEIEKQVSTLESYKPRYDPIKPYLSHITANTIPQGNSNKSII